MYKVYAIGEYLIDFLNTNGQTYVAQAGGAPANVAACVSKLGGEAALISTIGNDIFKPFLLNTMVEANVDINQVSLIDKPNMLAFVQLNSTGDRQFHFYNHDTANSHLDQNRIKSIPFNHDILHFCSVSLQGESNIQAHLEAIKKVVQSHGIISFDPNLRFNLWSDFNEMKQIVLRFLEEAHLVKVSEEELEFLTNEADEVKAVKKLWTQKTAAIWVTKGANGVTLYTKNESKHFPGIKVNVVDTTGAGDAFIGALLFGIQQQKSDLEHIKLADWIRITQFANEKAALTTTRFGAIPSYIF